jgi:hypothetical protein
MHDRSREVPVIDVVWKPCRWNWLRAGRRVGSSLEAGGYRQDRVPAAGAARFGHRQRGRHDAALGWVTDSVCVSSKSGVGSTATAPRCAGRDGPPTRPRTLRSARARGDAEIERLSSATPSVSSADPDLLDDARGEGVVSGASR